MVESVDKPIFNPNTHFLDIWYEIICEYIFHKKKKKKKKKKFFFKLTEY